MIENYILIIEKYIYIVKCRILECKQKGVTELEKKTVLITGGGRNIGLEITRAFAQRGYDIAVTGRNEAVVQETAREYLQDTTQVAQTAQDRDLSEDSMVIGTSAIVDTEIDGAVGMNSGIFNNPFIIWGKYRKKLFRYELPISFQFHHTQMDGAHAGRFLENLQQEINRLK